MLSKASAEFRPRGAAFDWGDSPSSRVCAKSEAEQQLERREQFSWHAEVRVIKEAGWLRPGAAAERSTTGLPNRSHNRRAKATSPPPRGGYKPKLHRADAEKILAAELAAINGGPVTRAADGTITLGNWMQNFYIPMRGANWRDATRPHQHPLPKPPRLSDSRTRRAQRHH
jgi:hypothetical protein